jgi:hypothetical protein
MLVSHLTVIVATAWTMSRVRRWGYRWWAIPAGIVVAAATGAMLGRMLIGGDVVIDPGGHPLQAAMHLGLQMGVVYGVACALVYLYIVGIRYLVRRDRN